MSSDADIPREFRESVFPHYVRYVTASAVIASQYTERVLNAICLILGSQQVPFSLEDFMSGDSARIRQTLGMIEKSLRSTGFFDPSFSDRLANFTRRRNRVVHGLFADTFKSGVEIRLDSPNAMQYVAECEWVAREAGDLVELGFGIYRALGDLLMSSNPKQPELAGVLRSFDEFYKVGLASLAPWLRPHFAEGRAGSTN